MNELARPHDARPDARAPLRFGVMCRGHHQPRWAAEALRELIASGAATPALVIRDATPDRRAPARSPLHRMAAIPFRLFNRYSQRRAGVFEPRSIAAELEGVDEIRCVVETKGRFSEYFSEKDLEVIRAHDLDFIVRFGFGIIRGAIHESARYGVWSYHHDDEREFRGAPPCFWSLFQGRPTTGAILQRLTDRLDGGVVLERGTFGTGFSYAANLARVYSGSAAWLRRAALRVQSGDTAAVEAGPSTTSAPIYFTPGPLTMVRHGVRQAVRAGGRMAGRVWQHDVWNVGVARVTPTQLIDDGLPEDVTWAPHPPVGTYRADPFPTSDDPRTADILFEDYSYWIGRGRIGSVPVAGLDRDPEFTILLDEPFHLSYPFVSAATGGGEPPMLIPEAAEADNLPTYRLDDGHDLRATRRPLGLGSAVLDPTLLHYEGRWWIFGGLAPTAQYELRVWYGPSRYGPWTPHPLNPVKTDLASARPAGAFWRTPDGLFRPGQDSTRGYGSAVRIHRVLELTPDSFREQEVAVIPPPPHSRYRDGIHTLNWCGDLAVIDGKSMVGSPLTPILRAVNWLRARRRARSLSDAATPTPSTNPTTHP